MDRNAVIVDGTKPTATTACSAKPSDQDPGVGNQGRTGIEVYGIDKSTNPITQFLADGVSIDNLTVCNFLTGSHGGTGNEIWWNGGDGTGALNKISIGLRGYEGSYLTATSSYSSTTNNGTMGPCCGTGFPAANYGIFSSNSTGPLNGAAHGVFSSISNSYASNQADSDFYIGACAQRCDVVLSNDHGQYSSLCVSATNAGGYYVMDRMECDLNKDGPVSNSQNNDDAPSPQIGLCDSADPTTEPQTGVLGTKSCTVWSNGNWHDNNNPNVPGNANNGLAGAGPVGTGVILAGTTYSTLYHNTITNNKAWGELTVDLPDPESGPAMCQGGTDVLVPAPPATVPTEVCYYKAFGNVSLDNTFSNNGGYGNPTNGDIALASIPNNPGNCYSGDTDAAGVAGAPTTDPAGIETNPAYTPSGGMCTTPNAGDEGPLLIEAECASQLLAPCPVIQNAVCQMWPASAGPCPQPVNPPPATLYPQATTPFTLTTPLSDPTHALTPTMPDPCLGVPSNPWCLSWKLQTTLNPSGATASALYGTACPSATACTAVGYSVNSSGVRTTLAESWNGTNWSIQPTPNPAGAKQSTLFGVSCPPATTLCTAVGNYINSAGAWFTLVEHWDGTRWTIQPSPNPNSARETTLFGVACPSTTQCTAVGRYANTAGVVVTLAEQLKGGVWSIQPTANVSGAKLSFLAGVACPSLTSCITVGYSTNNSGANSALVEQWNGSTWAIQTSAALSGAKASTLSSIACASGTLCTTVGNYVNSSGVTVGLAERWSPGAWSLQTAPSPAGAKATALSGVACPSTTQCTAVGNYVAGNGVALTLAEGWNSAGWAIQSTPNPVGAKGSALFSVACPSTILCTAAWDYASSAGPTLTLVERYS
jgi:hypothetical protein